MIGIATLVAVLLCLGMLTVIGLLMVWGIGQEK